jgi:hypothetical protein
MVKARGPLVALLALFVLVGDGLFLEIRSHQTEPRNHSLAVKTDQQNQQSGDSAVNPSGEHKRDGRSQEHWYQVFLEHFLEHPTDWLLVLFSFLLAAFTARLFYATYGIAQETRRIGEAQVRAYVSIKSVMIAFFGSWEHPLVRFVAFNTGQSPARNFIWNITVQYEAGKNKQTSSFDKNWQNKTGFGIPAASDAPSDERAIIPKIPLKNFRELDKSLHVVVRVRIDFRYTDVFERDWFGESYFHGIGPEPGAKQPEKGFALSPTARPNDWEE